MSIERFPIEAGQIMLFARSIGDPNPVYYDAEYAATTEVGGIVAPPTFVQAGAQYDDDYPLRPKIGEPWFGSGRTDSGSERSDRIGATGSSLHAEQHFEYHRPLRPGDVLHTTVGPGRTWEKLGRSGRLVFTETIIRYLDGAGDPVVTATTVSVQTEGPKQ